MLARIVLEASFYDPASHLKDVRAPVLLRAATRDALCPLASVREAAAALRAAGNEVELWEVDATHLRAHRDGLLPQNLAPVVAFLRKHLLAGAA